MLCLFVQVNGETAILAGDGAAESLTASVKLYPSFKESVLRVDGEVVPDNSVPADATWLGRALQVGDTVVVRLVESDSAMAPALSRSDPSVAAVDGVSIVCSFCGKSPHEIQRMYSGIKATICNECLALFHQMSIDGAI
jgi:hypothetical protein